MERQAKLQIKRHSKALPRQYHGGLERVELLYLVREHAQIAFTLADAARNAPKSIAGLNRNHDILIMLSRPRWWRGFRKAPHNNGHGGPNQ